MFLDGTNLLFEHINLRTLSSISNEEVKKMYEWFNGNKLTQNADKTKYSVVHKPLKTGYIPLLLRKLFNK